jgi:hypothetical protein
MKLPLYLAALGLAASVAAHVASLLGGVIETSSPLFWVLHIGAMLLPPAAGLFWLQWVGETGQRATWQGMTRLSPRWMRVTAYALVAYGVFNFFFTGMVLSEGGIAQPAGGGEGALVDHGKIIRRLSAREYQQFRAYPLRMSSGMWMLLYALATTIFWGVPGMGNSDTDVDVQMHKG